MDPHTLSSNDNLILPGLRCAENKKIACFQKLLRLRQIIKGMTLGTSFQKREPTLCSAGTKFSGDRATCPRISLYCDRTNVQSVKCTGVSRYRGQGHGAWARWEASEQPTTVVYMAGAQAQS